MRQKARLAQEQAAQEGAHYGRTSHRRRISRKGKKVITAAVIAAAVCLVFLYAEKRSYHSYKVLNTSEQEDVVSTQYVDMDGDILRYSPDGVSVVDNSMNTIWNETYTMQNPIADVNGSRAVVADSEGTSLYICDKKGVMWSSAAPTAAASRRKWQTRTYFPYSSNVLRFFTSWRKDSRYSSR